MAEKLFMYQCRIRRCNDNILVHIAASDIEYAAVEIFKLWGGKMEELCIMKVPNRLILNEIKDKSK